MNDVKDVPQEFSGSPFSAVFRQPQRLAPSRWRIHNSGVRGWPEESAETRAVVAACEALGISVERYWMGSAAHLTSYHLRARFLDGGLDASTGEDLFSQRGAWIEGPKAVLLVALKLGLTVRQAWRQKFNLEGVTLDSLALYVFPINTVH